LRLWQIGALPPGLHYDEAADTIIRAADRARRERARSLWRRIPARKFCSFIGPALWMQLIGPSAFAMRLAAAMLGVLTVAVTYWTRASCLHHAACLLTASSKMQEARCWHFLPPFSLRHRSGTCC